MSSRFHFEFERLEPRRLLSTNIDPRFAVLAAEYEAYLAGGAQGEFQPSDKTVIVEDGRVWLEAFYWSDRSQEERIRETFAAAGFESTSNVPFDESACLCGWMPITSLDATFYDATRADEIWGLDAMPEPGTIDFVDQSLLELEAEYRAYLENPSGDFKPSTPFNGLSFLILNDRVGVTLYFEQVTAETRAALDSLGFEAQFESEYVLYGWLSMTAPSSLPTVPGFLSARQTVPAYTRTNPALVTIDPTPRIRPFSIVPDVVAEPTQTTEVAPAEWKTGHVFASPDTDSFKKQDENDDLDFTTS